MTTEKCNISVRVSSQRCDSYEQQVVSQSLQALLDPLGGVTSFVSRGDRVLLKPNFLVAARPERAVNTHPAVIKAVAMAALEAGAASVVVADSPGVGSGRHVARKLGLIELLAPLGVEVVELDDSVTVDNREGEVFKRLEISRTVLDADKVINLAKLKTHAQMGMTLAVKNTFGCVVGPRKAAWHMEAGRDALLFARMLTDLHHRVAPALHLVDGVVAMEGNGPGSGTPREVGVLAASREAALLDDYLCELVGFQTEELATHRVAMERGLEVGSALWPDLAGPRPDEFGVRGFRFARPQKPAPLPGALLAVARRLVEVRPVVDPVLCTGCGTCSRVCPVAAVESRPRKQGQPLATFLRNRCIHCFVCQETCPEGAIHVGKGLARRLLNS